MSHDPATTAWIEEAMAVPIERVAEAVLNIKMPKHGEFQGPCPACGGSDRFSVNIRKQVFNCRGGGSGKSVQMVQHARGVDFMAACEMINGFPPPNRESAVRPPDPAVEKERREERRDDRLAAARADAAEAARDAGRAAKLFGQHAPIAGTIVEDYLERRGIFLHTFDPSDFGMIQNLAYRGFADRDAEEEVELGQFHCMVAAVRDAHGQIQGVHRTYIDPSGATKLRPPGDHSRNKAKKGYGRMGGGLIMLKPPDDVLAVAEGIETGLSWWAMAREGEFGDEFGGAGIAAAYSLGNLCGSATGTVPHPTRKNATIANGEPNMESGAIWIPAGVKKIALLGDGDSDAATTRALLRTGAERFRRLGLEVFVHMAPDGMDFNDVLLSRRKTAA